MGGFYPPLSLKAGASGGVFEKYCCDLLSNSVLLIFDSNTGANSPDHHKVVICFQIGFQRSLITTTSRALATLREL
jgi:hypothetical protein